MRTCSKCSSLEKPRASLRKKDVALLGAEGRAGVIPAEAVLAVHPLASADPRGNPGRARLPGRNLPGDQPGGRPAPGIRDRVRAGWSGTTVPTRWRSCPNRIRPAAFVRPRPLILKEPCPPTM